MTDLVSSTHQDTHTCIGTWTIHNGPVVDHFGGRHPKKVAIDEVTIYKSSECDYLDISVSGEIVGTTMRAHDSYWTGSDSKPGPGLQYPAPAWLVQLLYGIAADEIQPKQLELLEAWS